MHDETKISGLSLSDNSVVAVLQVTQLEHERKITQNAADIQKQRELFDSKFDEMRRELHTRDENLYRRMDENAKESARALDKIENRLENDAKEQARTVMTLNANAETRVTKLTYYIMGATLSVLLAVLGMVIFLIERVHP